MRRLACSLLVWVVFVGCGEDEMIQEQPKTTQTEVVDGPLRVITWQKDGASMALIPAGSFEIGDHFGE